RIGDLVSNEVVILLRGITILRHLHHVESELCLAMRSVVFSVPDRITELRPQFGILNGNGLVDSRMAGDVRSVVGQRAEGKGVLVGVLALQKQFANEVTAADVMH